MEPKTVYLLSEYIPQPEFTDKYGEIASECMLVLAVYENLEDAIAERNRRREIDKELQKEFGCDECEYHVMSYKLERSNHTEGGSA